MTAAPPAMGPDAGAPPSAAVLANPALRLGLWLLLAGLYFATGLETPYQLGFGHDWFYFDHHFQAAYRSLADHGQIPQWNPWHCGGIPAAGNLQTNAAAPSLLLSLLFGLEPGARIFYLLLFVAGLEGAYRYASHRGAAGLGALAAALLFCASGRFVGFLHSGQPTFLAFLLFPWALLALERGLVSWRAAVGGGFVMALLFLEAGAIPFPMIAIILGVVALCLSALALARRFAPDLAPATPSFAWHRPLVVVGVMVGLAVLLAAFSVLPRAETLVTVPRVLGQFDAREAYNLGHVLNMLFERGSRVDAIGDGAAYVGHFAGLLFLLAVALRAPGAAFLMVLSILVFDLATGWKGYLGVFHAVHSLPIVENIRAPYRYTVFLAFFVAVGAGLGLAALERRLARSVRGVRERATAPWRRHLPAVGAGLLLVGLAATSVAAVVTTTHPRFEGLFGVDVAQRADEPFRQSVGNRWHAHVWPSVNVGTLTCFEEQPFPTSPRLRGDLPAEEYLDDPTAGAVTRRAWSPHRITLDVALFRPATLLVNQNAHRAWSTSVGERVDAEGLLAVALPAGDHEVVLTFSDPLFNAGLGVSALTLVGLALLAWRARRRRRVDHLSPPTSPTAA